jgi:fatty-acyl-CoA synthase
MILTESLQKAKKIFGKKEAIICGNDRLSYTEVVNRVNGLSLFLLSKKVRKRKRVAILLPNNHYFLEAYYAIANLGAIAVPLNYRLSGSELAYIIEDSESHILIADREFSSLVASIFKQGAKALTTLIWVGEGEFSETDREALDYNATLKKYLGGEIPEIKIDENDVAQIYYTSGTTGKPKGVVLTHKNVSTHALGAIAELHLTDRDRWLHVAPMFHLADAWATWAITWVGGTHIFISSFDPGKVLHAMELEKVTITNLIPTMFNFLVNYPNVKDHDYSHLRLLLSGGAPITPNLVRQIIETFGCDYLQTYGMTETSPYLTLSRLKEHHKELSYEKQLEIKSTTGREFITVQLKVIRNDGTEVSRDGKEVGEIIVKGDTVTKGYWNLPDETAKQIKNGWLFTGDLAVVDEEGYVTIVDRKKDMIITGGENVYSTEVENILSMHPAILEAAVIGIPDEKWGEAVKAIVTLRPGMNASEEEIINFCKERIARYKAPKSINFVNALPRTGPGKIAKKELRNLYSEKCSGISV